jgi:hypothetical protein
MIMFLLQNFQIFLFYLLFFLKILLEQKYMSSGAKSAISEQIHILSHFIGQLTCSERNNLAWTAKISSKAQHHHAQVLSTVVAGAAPRHAPHHAGRQA